MATELTESEIKGVVRLVADAEAVDHMRALNEAALLQTATSTSDHASTSW